MIRRYKGSIPWIPQIGSPSDVRLFSLAEAESLLPVVRKVTDRAIEDFEPVRLRYRNLLDCDPRKSQLASEYEKIARQWVAKMGRFGLVVRGLWKVDFDTGDGYLSWRYPELRLAYFVDAGDPKSKRRHLSDVFAEHLPSWA